ncbi:hypothetical protein Rhe02_54540 [Rhizocola hellebori]|uniref:Uncharacterized protein n=1 Tax=Rhizocola hellebori TaxID=1392758 RepID=A0A8J3QD11_9ACTN|nr:hypothetical protein [Rhizocola hellebori]GIH07387.1 hypothetical protein Rhe02_54540 [Rhizocola hellebori]
MSDSKTIYVSIGNSDDKLTQREWADFVSDVQSDLVYALNPYGLIHGRWLSIPDAPFQNACWCVQFKASHGDAGQTVDEHMAIAKARLAKLAKVYRQDSIAWAEAITEFIGPGVLE